uniref:Uncharacterized protein n=1 Tax=Vitis vinifera TaxID=29760 RepID=F6GVL1_VITVI
MLNAGGNAVVGLGDSEVVLGDSQMHYMSVHHAEKCGAKFFDKENIGSPPLLNTVICLMCKHSSKL